MTSRIGARPWPSGHLRAVLAIIAVGAGTVAFDPSVASAVGAGAVFGFGDNYFGALGATTNNGSDAANAVPTSITLPGQSGGVIAAAVGVHSLVVTASDQLYTFGFNDAGQLGDNQQLFQIAANPTPTVVSLPGESGKISQVAVGYETSYVVTTGGQLYSFGIDSTGELGTSSPTPVYTPQVVSLPSAAVQVVAGSNSALVLTASGAVYGFGSNFYGQLGNTTHLGTTTANQSPTLVVFPGESGTVTQIAEGGGFTLALTSGGQLYGFGDNSFGELGTTHSGTPVTTPTVITLPSQSGTVTHIAAGYDQSLVSTSSGQLYAFGGNHDGELGLSANFGTNTYTSAPTLVTSLPSQSGSIVALVAGYNSSYVLRSGGQIYAFGNNGVGQLGIPTTTSTTDTPTLVQIPSSTSIDAVAASTVSSNVSTLAISAFLSVSTSTLPSGQVGTPYSSAVTGSGGIAPYSWSASGLAPGMAISSTTGAITGTPTASGTFTPVVTVTDAKGIQSSTTLSMPIAAAPVVTTTTTATATSVVTTTPQVTATTVAVTTTTSVPFIPVVAPAKPAPAPVVSIATSAIVPVKSSKSVTVPATLSCSGAACSVEVTLNKIVLIDKPVFTTVKGKKVPVFVVVNGKRVQKTALTPTSVAIGSSSAKIAKGAKSTLAIALNAAGVAQLSTVSTKKPVSGDQLVVDVKGGKSVTKSVTFI